MDILPAPATAGMVAGGEAPKGGLPSAGPIPRGTGRTRPPAPPEPCPLNPEPRSSFPAVGTTLFETGQGEGYPWFASGRVIPARSQDPADHKRNPQGAEVSPEGSAPVGQEEAHRRGPAELGKVNEEADEAGS